MRPPEIRYMYATQLVKLICTNRFIDVIYSNS